MAKRPLSRYTQRALQNRHLEVLVTLLMLKIEEEQEQYRKLMRLAEELCIEDGGDESNEKVGIFKRGTAFGDSEQVLELKALCHVSRVISELCNILLSLLGTFTFETCLHLDAQENPFGGCVLPLPSQQHLPKIASTRPQIGIPPTRQRRRKG